MYRLLICDDQEIIREGLQRILKASAEWEVVGLACDGAEVLELIPRLHPDLVLMDLKMPGMNGVVATRKIREQYPQVRVLVLTTYDDDEWVFDAIRSGAAGYLLKDTPREALITAIKGTLEGNNYVDPAVAGKLLAHIAQSAPPVSSVSMPELSEREKEILRLLGEGLSNAEIARRLYLSEGTVRNYTSAIFDKLGVSDRTQAALMALRYGLIERRS